MSNRQERTGRPLSPPPFIDASINLCWGEEGETETFLQKGWRFWFWPGVVQFLDSSSSSSSSRLLLVSCSSLRPARWSRLTIDPWDPEKMVLMSTRSGENRHRNRQAVMGAELLVMAQIRGSDGPVRVQDQSSHHHHQFSADKSCSYSVFCQNQTEPSSNRLLFMRSEGSTSHFYLTVNLRKVVQNKMFLI